MRYAVLMLVCLGLLGPITNAQVEQGDKEVQLLGSVVTAESMAMVTLQFTYGAFITPNIELGAGPVIRYTKLDKDSYTQVSSAFFGRYYFSVAKKKVPYISAQWFQADFSPDEGASFTDAAYLQFGGGVKLFVSEYIAYDVSANYGFGLGGGSGAFSLQGGLSAFF